MGRPAPVRSRQYTRLTGPGSQATPPLGPRTDHPSGLARAGALRARVVTLRLPRPGLSGSGSTLLTPAHPRAHLHSMCSHLLHFGLNKSPSLVCATRPACVRTTIGGVSHLFCLGMVQPNGPSDPISGQDVKWDLQINKDPWTISASALLALS
jgi:hypothetical protein